MQPRQKPPDSIETNPSVEFLLGRLLVPATARPALPAGRHVDEHGAGDADLEGVLDQEAQVLRARLAESRAHGAVVWAAAAGGRRGGVT